MRALKRDTLTMFLYRSASGEHAPEYLRDTMLVRGVRVLEDFLPLVFAEQLLPWAKVALHFDDNHVR